MFIGSGRLVWAGTLAKVGALIAARNKKANLAIFATPEQTTRSDVMK
jgi:hypothetical protein